MRTYLFTGLISLVIGIGLGLFLGWVQFPVEYQNSHMCQLDWQYQEEYTVMVARGYRQDQDLTKAIERLRPLRVEGVDACDDGRDYVIDNLADWIVYLTELKISQGADLRDIQDLAFLARGLGRTTPLIESVPLPETVP